MTHHVPSYPGSPHEDHWPSYDPVGPHHHPKHPPYMIDRCADECDDQLPLFSQVGRGLQGEGYKVEVSYDDTDETYLTGYYHDPHTGADTLDWMSENINGGRLYYSYHIRNFTDPQTFTITFRYVRPNRDADEEGTVWSWTSPAIPYVGDEDMGDLIASWVSTLYLRKKGENWNWRQHEKLTYPEGMTHQSVNAPGPEEGWTVNLTYGIDEDCDIVVPTVEDLANIIGMDPDEIYNLVKRGLPSDVIPDGMNVKQYIDSVTKSYEVVSGTPNLLSVVKNVANKVTTFTLKVLLGAGKGIKLIKNNQTGNMDIAANITSGPGISVSDGPDNSIKITNTQVGGDWIWLEPGVDYDFKWHGGWYAGVAQQEPAHETNPSNKGVPYVQVIPSYNTDGDIINAQIRVRAYGTLQNMYDLLSKDSGGELNRFYFQHSSYLEDAPLAAILSISFKGEWASLNNLNVLQTQHSGVRTWNVRGTNEPIDNSGSTTTTWHNCGASWDITSATEKNDGSSALSQYKQFIFTASAISDGYNAQYDRPPYGYAHLCIRPWANWTIIVTLV